MNARRVLFVHASSALRRRAALDVLVARPRDAEIVVLGASLGSVDDLVRELTAASGARLGLYRKTIGLHALDVAAPRLAERGDVPATHLATLGAVRAALGRPGVVDPARLGQRTVSRGLLLASHRTVQDLRLAGVEASAIPEDDTGLPIAVRVLLDAYAEELRQRRLADAADLLREAGRAIASGGESRRDLLLVDVPIRSRLEAEMLAAMVDAAPNVHAVAHAADESTLAALDGLGFVREGEDATDASPLDRVRRALFASADARTDEAITPSEGSAGVELVAAESEPAEALEIARRVVAATEDGVRFDEIAIALSSPGLYVHHVEEALRRAGVPAFFATGSGGAPDPNGRALGALVAYRAERHAATRFLEYLSLGRAPAFANDAHAEAEELGALAEVAAPPVTEEPNQDAVSLRRLAPRRLESLFKGALLGLGADVDQGETIAAFFARRVDASLARATLERDRLRDDDGDVAAIEREIVDLGAFRAFLVPVAAALDALPERATWGTWIERLDALATCALTEPNLVLARLSDLRALDGPDHVDIHEVRGVLEDRLVELRRPPLASRAGRVFVAHPRELYGRTFRHVLAPGLSERVFPARPRPDPLLDDERRHALGMPATVEWGIEERFSLHLVFSAARERVVVTYPRVEWTIGRPRVPSFYALDVARATLGHLPRIEDLERAARERSTLAPGWPAPARLDDAIDLAEHDLATVRALLDDTSGRGGVLRPFLDESPHLARALRQRYARLEQEGFTASDGMVRPSAEVRAILEKRSPRARAYATSTLQDFAPCPYRFHLSAIVGIPRPQPPEVLAEIDPRSRGDLFHDTLATFLRTAIDEHLYPLDARTVDDARGRLRAAFEGCADAVAERVHPSFRKVFDRARETVWEDLEGFLRREARPGETHEPAHADLAFGLPIGPRRDPASRAEPVTIDVGDGAEPLRVLLKGAIDAVERDRATGTVRVTDYKTGALRDRGPVLVGGGEVLQGLLYALAFKAMFPGTAVSGARFYFATARGAYEERPMLFTPLAGIEASRFFSLVVRAIEEGFLPAWPREGACARCAYLAICGPGEEARSRRKRPRGDTERFVLDELVQLRARP